MCGIVGTLQGVLCIETGGVDDYPDDDEDDWLES